jgi:threonine aldolase
MYQIYDFRSDTITLPSKGMLDAMMSAKVGDDVFEEDETINKLENKLVEMFGMESGIFCPSGTMTNQIAIRVHVKPGDEVICSRQSHIYNYEGGGIAANSGASVRLIESESGLFTANDVKINVNPDDVHLPVSKLVSVENTSNRGGGVCFDLDEMKKIGELCKKHELKYHIDGARIFNAIVRNNENPKDYGKIFDSISICLSKGLGCPVGSVLLGSQDFIKKARRVRKVFGGGMRQAGYLAAAGIFAVENNISRLIDDHKRATELAKHWQDYKHIKSVIMPETNIVVFYLDDNISPQDYCNLLAEKNVIAIPFGNNRIRMVTHLDIDDEGIDTAVIAMKSL